MPWWRGIRWRVWQGELVRGWPGWRQHRLCVPAIVCVRWSSDTDERRSHETGHTATLTFIYLCFQIINKKLIREMRDWHLLQSQKCRLRLIIPKRMKRRNLIRCVNARNEFENFLMTEANEGAGKHFHQMNPNGKHNFVDDRTLWIRWDVICQDRQHSYQWTHLAEFACR